MSSLSEAEARERVPDFEFRLYDLFSGEEKKLQAHLNGIADDLGFPRLRGTLYTIAQELAGNALKAIYKRAYYTYMLAEIGLTDLPYGEWLVLFKTEIESHRAENFAHLCREKDLYVTVRGGIADGAFFMEARNQGTPSDVEWARLQRSIESAQNVEDLSAMFLDDSQDKQKEAGGLGIPLIIMSLRGLGAPPDCFQIQREGDNTIAGIRLPIEGLNRTASMNL